MAGVRGWVEREDAFMDSEQAPGGDPVVDTARAEPCLGELLQPHQLLLPRTDLDDLMFPIAPTGRNRTHTV